MPEHLTKVSRSKYFAQRTLRVKGVEFLVIWYRLDGMGGRMKSRLQDVQTDAGFPRNSCPCVIRLWSIRSRLTKDSSLPTELMEDCHTHPDRFEIRTIFYLPTNILAFPGLLNTAKEKTQEYYFVGFCPIRIFKAQHLNSQQDQCSWG